MDDTKSPLQEPRIAHLLRVPAGVPFLHLSGFPLVNTIGAWLTRKFTTTSILVVIVYIHYIFFIPSGTHNLARNVILPDLNLLLSIPVLIESEVLLLVQFFPQITPSLPMK